MVSGYLAKVLFVRFFLVKPYELPMSSLKEPTHLCGKIVRRLVGRGEKPNEPGDSWLSEKEF